MKHILNNKGFSLVEVAVAGVIGAISVGAYYASTNYQQRVLSSTNRKLVAENYATELIDLFRGMGTQGTKDYLVSKGFNVCDAVNVENGIQILRPDSVAALTDAKALGPEGGHRSYEVRVANVKTMTINSAKCGPANELVLSRDESYLLKVKVDWGPNRSQSIVLSGAVVKTNGCGNYASAAPFEALYRSVLGRVPTEAETTAAMVCIAAGSLSAIDLESSVNPANANCPSVAGLRSLPEYRAVNDDNYGHKVEAISNIFRVLLGRWPNAAELSTYVGQMSTVNNTNYNTQFISRLRTVSTNIRNAFASDITTYRNANVANGFSGKNPAPLQDLYSYLGITKAISATTVNSLSTGDITLRTIVSNERGSVPYINRGTTQLAQNRMEQWVLMYHSLTGNLPDAATVTAYSRVMDIPDVDWPAAGGERFDWLASDLRSSDAYRNAGGCMVAAPTPLCVANILATGGTWNAATGYTINGSTWTVNPPGPATYAEMLTAFGTISQVQWQGDNPTTNTFGAPQGGVYPATAVPMATLLDPPAGSAISAAATVTGPGGTSSCGQTRVAAARKNSCLVRTHTNNNHSSGPSLGGISRIDQVRVYVPAPDLTNLWPTEGVTTPSLQLLYKWGSYGGCTKSGLHFGGTSNSAPQGSLNGPDCGSHYGPGRDNTGGSWDSTGNGWTYRQWFERDMNPTHSRDLATLYPQLTTPYSATNRLGPNPNMSDYFIPGLDTGLGMNPPFTMPKTSVTVDGSAYVFRNGAFGSTDCVHVATNTSPLVVDLYQEGVTFTPPEVRTYFELSDAGTKGSFFWLGNPNNSAFLAIDANENGKIDHINELFGDNTVGPDAKKEENGFLALKKHDTNRDGKIDGSDSIFTRLLLWFDKNQNGVSELNEIQSLAMSGIMQLDLDYLSVRELADNYGNYSGQRSVAVMNDGSYRKVFDVWVVPNGLESERNVSSH